MKKVINFIGTYTLVSFAYIGLRFILKEVSRNV